MKLIYGWITFLFCFASAQAGERLEFYNGIRALGMGGATIAVVNDETTLIQNPAALGKLRESYITVLDFEMDVGSETQSVVDSDIAAFMDPQDTLDQLELKPTKKFYQRAQTFPSLVFPNFGIGFLGKYETSATINTTTNKLDLKYTNDFAGVMGFNIRLFDGMVKIGGSGRVINRSQIIRDDIDTTEANLKMDTFGKEGIGVAADAGIMLAAPITWLPTIAAVYRDVGHTRYDTGSGLMHDTTDEPDPTKPTLDVAFALFPILGKGTRMTITGELRDVLKTVEDGQSGRPEDAVARRTHAGIEFNFSDFFFLRAGMHQRYWSAGIEIALFSYQLQLASYGEDIGTKADPEEDRRYVGKFTWRF